jgi:hypothetical protein
MLKIALALALTMACALYPAVTHAQNTQTPQRSLALPEEQEEAQVTKTVEVTPPAETGVTVAPAGCDFEVTFPADPYSSRRCPDGADGRCYDLTRYTMVYDMTTTVDVRFSCNPMSENQFYQYNEQVTRMALNGMAARNNVVESTTHYTQENDVKKTTLTGSGTSGRQNKIYIAQLWLTPRSILTMEAELIGDEHGRADAVFGDIISSIRLKGAQAAAEPTPAPESGSVQP